VIAYPGLSRRELNFLIRRANAYFYLRPRVFLKNLRLLLSPLALYRSLVALKRKFL
jgi:hypothetical protein